MFGLSRKQDFVFAIVSAEDVKKKHGAKNGQPRKDDGRGQTKLGGKQTDDTSFR